MSNDNEKREARVVIGLGDSVVLMRSNGGSDWGFPSYRQNGGSRRSLGRKCLERRFHLRVEPSRFKPLTQLWNRNRRILLLAIELTDDERALLTPNLGQGGRIIPLSQLGVIADLVDIDRSLIANIATAAHA